MKVKVEKCFLADLHYALGEALDNTHIASDLDGRPEYYRDDIDMLSKLRYELAQMLGWKKG